MTNRLNRPGVHPTSYAFRDADRKETPGIALWGTKGLVAHLTYPEAVTLSDRLHDLVDAAGSPEPALPTTPAEPE